MTKFTDYLPMKTKITVILTSFLIVSTALAESLVGVGLMLYKRGAKAPVKVVAVTPGSPAAKAGIKPEFAIATIDGTNTEDLSVAECMQRLRGAPDTQVALGVVDPTLHRTNTVTLKRVGSR